MLSYALVGQGAMLENSKRVGNGGQAITQRVGGGRGVRWETYHIYSDLMISLTSRYHS